MVIKFNKHNNFIASRINTAYNSQKTDIAIIGNGNFGYRLQV
jgi:hypothetical protein